MKSLNSINKWLFAVCLMLGILISSLSAQEIIGDEDDDMPENLVIADQFLVKVNGKVVPITENLEVPEGQRLFVNVSQLKPHTYVTVQFQKAGMRLETRRFLANHNGALDFEILTPKPGIGGTANLKYIASSGKENEMKIKVRFNKSLKL